MVAKSLNPGKTMSAPPGGPTKSMACVCQNEFQDVRYGKGKRLYNRTKNGWRCTVCSRSTLS